MTASNVHVLVLGFDQAFSIRHHVQQILGRHVKSYAFFDRKNVFNIVAEDGQMSERHPSAIGTVRKWGIYETGLDLGRDECDRWADETRHRNVHSITGLNDDQHRHVEIPRMDIAREQKEVRWSIASATTFVRDNPRSGLR